MPKKIKIAWICHFNNEFFIKNLPLSSNMVYQEFAPWIPETLKHLEDVPELEIHVIAPYRGLSKLYFSIKKNNITYHFFKSDIPFIEKKFWKIPFIYYRRFFTGYPMNNYLVKKIIKNISPDLIHLHGAENAYYSSSILQFKNKYPILITIQGFIRNTTEKHSKTIKYKIKIEEKILKTFKHFGYRTKKMGETIKEINPKAQLHWHFYGLTDVKLYNFEKKYDIVFFARICKDKGIEDLLKAVSLVKKNKPNLSLLVIGPVVATYLTYLKTMVKNLDIEKNVFWFGFQKNQKEVHKLASKAKISVLPTYHDIIPGTIIESMKLKIPVISYDVGSISELNDTGENIILVEKGNINDLANKINYLLENEKIFESLKEKAFKAIYNKFDNSKIPQQYTTMYRNVIEDFKKNRGDL